MRNKTFLHNPVFAPVYIESERQKAIRKLQGIDLAAEYELIRQKQSRLSRSMRELVVREVERRKNDG